MQLLVRTLYKKMRARDWRKSKTVTVKTPALTIKDASKMHPLAKVARHDLGRGHERRIVGAGPRADFVVHSEEVDPEENLSRT